MKKSAAIVTVVITGILLVLLCCSAGAPTTTRALHPDTPIYADTDYSSAKVFSIPQNAEVTRLGDIVVKSAVSWQKVDYNGYIGYVNNACLYEHLGEMSYSFKTVKTRSKKMGEEINLYEANSTDSRVLYSLKDGIRLNSKITEIDYGKFYEVQYEGEKCFVEISYTTTGLSYNEVTAIIVICVTLVAAVLAFFVIGYIKKASVRVRPKKDEAE